MRALEKAGNGSITRVVAINPLKEGDPSLKLALTTVEC